MNSDPSFWKHLCFKSFSTISSSPPFSSDDADADCLPIGRDWKWLFLCTRTKLTEESIRCKFSGIGCLTDSKILSIGEWKDGKNEGKGVHYQIKSSSRYVGDFMEGQPHGYGVLIEPGKIYRGHWKKKKRCGHGIQLYLSENRSFEGEWHNDSPNGTGVYIWGRDLPPSEQERYEGEFLQGRRHGTGFYFWPTGDRYEGSWREGSQHGFGTYYWTTGSRYEGMWKDNKKHDYGVFVWPNGDRFEGEWNEGFPVKVEESMHPNIIKAISEKRCTRSVPGIRSNLGQIYHMCSTCDIRVCFVCVSKCHNHHNCPSSLKFWSSLNNCGCTLCQPSPHHSE